MAYYSTASSLRNILAGLVPVQYNCPTLQNAFLTRHSLGWLLLFWLLGLSLLTLEKTSIPLGIPSSVELCSHQTPDPQVPSDTQDDGILRESSQIAVKYRR